MKRQDSILIVAVLMMVAAAMLFCSGCSTAGVEYHKSEKSYLGGLLTTSETDVKVNRGAVAQDIEGGYESPTAKINLKSNANLEALKMGFEFGKGMRP